MLELAGISFGVRDGVIVLIALLAIYMVFMIIRLRRALPTFPSAEFPARDLVTPPAAELEPASRVVEEFSPASGDASDSDWQQSAPDSMAPSEEALYRNLQNEVFQLRDEVDSLRGELAAMRQDMLSELGHMRAAQTVSPIYGDAMQMAVSGYDPAMIAERCGIARAEAELVVALAKSQST